MKTILALLAGLLGTGILAYFCATGHRDLIQQDLSDRTKSVLAGSTVSDLLVSADGREITLHGVVSSQQAKLAAEEAVHRISGVRTVINLLEVRVPESFPPPPSPVEAKPVVPPVPPPPLAEAKSVVPPSPPITRESVIPPPQKSVVRKAMVTPPARLQASAPNCQKALRTALGDKQIQFETGKAIIHPASYPVLDRLATVAKKCSATDIEISGHTDSHGGLRTNMTLSKNRAQAVIHYLVKRGVPAQHLTAIAHGPTKPIANNATAVGMQKNRRVEFTITGSRKKTLQR